MRATIVGCLLGLMLLGACKDDAPKEVPKGGPAPTNVKLGPQTRIIGIPLSIRLAKGWSAERLEGSDAPEPETAPPGLIDLSETLQIWKATTTSPTGRADPFILITVDKRLPKGTTLNAYLDALRKDQAKQVDAKITHLEGERIERDGRPGMSLRDTMDVPIPGGGKTPLHQVARVFINGTMGITVTAMMMDDDRPHVDAAVRAMLESLRFTTPPPRDDSF